MACGSSASRSPAANCANAWVRSASHAAAELLGGHARCLRDEREPLVAILDGVPEDRQRLRVEDGLQPGHELAVARLDDGVEGFAELEDAGGEIVGRVGGCLDGGVVATAAGDGEERQQRGEDGRGQREPNVHGASRAVVEHIDRSTVACVVDGKCWGG